MGYTPRILAFAGATRTESYNKKLIRAAAAIAEASGAAVTLLDLRDLNMPLYDGDLEATHGLPDGAKRLKAMLLEHDGLLISSPEYNSSISAVLKNSIDWASRPVQGQAPLAEFRGKVAGIMAASPGMLGGLRGLVHLRAILGNRSPFPRRMKRLMTTASSRTRRSIRKWPKLPPGSRKPSPSFMRNA